MKGLRNKFERFCFKHRNIGIPNLMLYVSIGAAIVYVLLLCQQYEMVELLMFDRAKILQGQVWRLITYVFVYNTDFFLFTIITLMCYFSLGRAMENVWGTLRFNLFYFTGVILMDVFCMIFGGQANVFYLNLSLFLGYATLYPNARFLLLFFIPVKAWIFALIDLIITVYQVVILTYGGLFPYSLFPLVAIANYFLFFGKDVVNVIPQSWQLNLKRLFRKRSKQQKRSGTVPFPSAGSYEATTATVKPPYTHRCVVCGRTDVSHPDLEFRYCSRCKGYFCYCEDHISNHTHVE